MTDFLVSIPMRAFLTARGEFAHLSTGVVAKTLCGTGTAVSGPLGSSDVFMGLGAPEPGVYSLCKTCRNLAKRGKSLEAKRRRVRR